MQRLVPDPIRQDVFIPDGIEIRIEDLSVSFPG